MSDHAENRSNGGRLAVLDDTKRRKIVALLANGSSRRVAARVVGCSHTTITRTAARDPDFAAELAAAEQTTEVEALRNIRRAARKNRYWRAAAWLVERKNPADFLRRTPTSLNENEIAQLLLRVLDPWIDTLPDTTLDHLLDHLHGIVELLHEQPDTRRLLKLPDPPMPKIDASTPSADRGFAPQIQSGDLSDPAYPTPESIAAEPLPAVPTAAPQPCK
jgi:hypothetical protein